MPQISATALARAGAKFQTVKELNKQDNVLGAFANVLTIISEVADTRHWSLLPSSIQTATSYDNSGTVNISSKYHLKLGLNQTSLPNDIKAINKNTNQISTNGNQLLANKNSVILLSSLSNKIHIANF
jgi:hypothetical protein